MDIRSQLGRRKRSLFKPELKTASQRLGEDLKHFLCHGRPKTPVWSVIFLLSSTRAFNSNFIVLLSPTERKEKALQEVQSFILPAPNAFGYAVSVETILNVFMASPNETGMM